MNNSIKAAIFGFQGETLSVEEKDFFKRTNPWGYILFKRNIGNKQQVKDLTQAIRDNVGWFCPIFVDQEGGRVARLGPPDFMTYPPAHVFGQMAMKDEERAYEACQLGANLIGYELRSVGITANNFPVLDLGIEGMHAVIGDRAYSSDPELVASLGAQAARGMQESGVLPVMKHIPGHGRSTQDSHEHLPHVKACAEELEKDFYPFKKNILLPAAMTAHIIYEAFDLDYPATLSSIVIHQLIRTSLGFEGLLLTDDLCMGALSSFGSLGKRAQRAFAAGCDIVLHCNGNLSEMHDVADKTPTLQGKAQQRAQNALQCISETLKSFDFQEAYERFKRIIS